MRCGPSSPSAEPARAPPSTRRTVPVTNDARSLSSHRAAWAISAISAGSAARRSGVAAARRCESPGEACSQVRIISVAVLPGAIALTRIPSGL